MATNTGAAGQSPCNGFPSNGLHMVNGPSDNHYASWPYNGILY